MKKFVFQQESNWFKRKAASFKTKGLTAVLCATMAVSPIIGYATEASTDGYISVSGKSDKNKQGNFVTIAVIDKDAVSKDINWKSLSGSEFAYYGEKELGGDLEYAFDFYLGDFTKNGVYTVYISSKTEDIRTEEIRYVNSVSQSEAFAQLKAKFAISEEETAAFLKDTVNLKKLGILCKFESTELDEDSAKYTAKLLVKDGLSETNVDNLCKKVEKAVIIGLLKNGESLPEGFENLLFTEDGVYKYYNENSAMYVSTDKLNSISDLDSEVIKGTALYYANDANDSKTLNTVLTTYKQELGITKSITDSIVNAVINKGDFTSVTSLAIYINNYKETSTGGNGTSGGSTGGGGGGGSYGSHSYSGTTLEKDEYEAPDLSQLEDSYAFNDVSDVPWAAEAIDALYANGVINGKEEGKFYPNDSITREEFVKMLVSAFSMKLVNEDISFEDVSEEDWSYDYIKTACIAGIIKGVSETHFGKEDNILRQDICVMINRLFDITDIKIAADGNAADKFKDFSDVADYAKDAVINMTSAGIMNGDENGYVNPKQTATRAETAKLMYGAINYYNNRR